MKKTILIVVGTQSGNTALVAEALVVQINAGDGVKADLLPEEDIPETSLKKYDGVLICTSSHGEGELPDCLLGLYSEFQQDAPDLSHIFFGLVALGDRTYHQTFCGAGRTMRELFLSLGARLIEPILEVDANTQPFADEVALGWVDGWLNNVLRELC